MPEISVIIPVYNAARTITETLNSVVEQTFNDIEILCINDGSTDESEEIIKNYQGKDKRIKLINQVNSGAGVARNNGIQLSQGKYITFLDSDDVFVPNAIELLYKSAIEKKSDLVRAPGYLAGSNSKKKLDWTLSDEFKNAGIFDWKTAPKSIFLLSAGNPWGMLILKTLLTDNNIVFPDYRRTEDICFTYLCYLHAKRICLVYEPIVCYRPQKQGMESTKIKYPLEPIKAREYLKEEITKIEAFDENSSGFYYRALISYFDMLNRLLTSNDDANAQEYYNKIKEIIDIEKIGTNCLADCTEPYRDLYSQLSKINRAKSYVEYKTSMGFPKKTYKYEPNLGIQPLVSIIMPMKNTENYVRQSINSILNQTLQNFELICIDDGSVDGTLKIVDSYAEKFPEKIKIIKQKASNAGVARNNGMLSAHGKYLIFLDSDDLFKPTLLEKSVKEMEKTWCDILIFEANVYNNKKHSYYKADWLLRWDYVPSTKFTAEDVPEYIFQITAANPWNKMYRSSFIWDNNLKYQSNKRANDLYFTFYALLKAKKIATLNESLVNWRTNNPHSLQGSNSETPVCFLNAFKMLKNTMVEDGIFDKYRQSFMNVLVSNICYTLKSIKTIKSSIKLINQTKKTLIALKFTQDDPSYYYEQDKYELCMNICNNNTFTFIRKYRGTSFYYIIGAIKKDGLIKTMKKI